MDSKNELRRQTSATTTDYPYINRSIWHNTGLASVSPNFNHDNGILSIPDIPNHLNQPFDSTTGQWRVLGLKANSVTTPEITLKFGFGADENSPLSAACGFTVGIPPLHSRHISTVTRCITYGFVVNAIAPSGNEKVLFIQHENSLINLGKDWSIAELEIQIKNNKIIYKSGGQVVIEANLTTPLPILYVLGAIRFANNTIININFSGGTLHNLQTPDYASEIYIPCLGLGSNKTQIELKLSSSATITYPDESELTLPANLNSWQTIAHNNFNKDVPFTLKIKIPNGLSNLLGIKVINPLRGFDSNSGNVQAMTETSLSRPETRNALTEIKELEIRGSQAETSFLSHTGELPIPEISSKLESAFIEGSFNADVNIDLIKHQQLKRIHLTQYIQQSKESNINPLSGTRLEKIDLSVEIARKLQQNSLINFRRLFNPSRTTQTHGFRIHTRTRGNTWGQSRRPFREWQNIKELAIAAESARLLYGETWVASINNRNGNYIELTGENTPTSEISEAIQNPANISRERNRDIASAAVLFPPDIHIPGTNESEIYGSSLPNNRFYRITYIESITPTSATILSSGGTFNFQNQGYLFIGEAISGLNQFGRLKLNTGNYLFRQVTSVSSISESKLLQNTRSTPNTQTVSFTKYTLTLGNIRNSVISEGRNIVSNSTNQANTFTVEIASNQTGSIFIGDTVWQETPNNPFNENFTQLSPDEHPAIVIGKQGNFLTLLQGDTNNKHPLLTAGSGQRLRFAYEFSRQPNPLSPQFITDIEVNKIYQDEIANISRTNNIRIHLNDSALQMYLRSYTN